MSQQVKIRHGLAASIAAATPVESELAYATDTKRLSIGDGLTAGGIPLAKLSEIPSVSGYAPLASPTFTGDPKAPTPSPGDNDTSLATTAFVADAVSTAVSAAVTALKGGVSTAFDTLAELAAGLKNLGNLTLAAGDTLYASGVDTLARLAKGSDGQVLTLASGVPSWATPSSRIARNRIVNPAMQISQENGNTFGSTNNYYAADQWFMSRVTSAGTFNAQRLQSVTPNGSKDRFAVGITVADASLAAGEFLMISTNIEGQEVADLQWGTASAQQIVVRFGFSGPAGTYAVSVNNSAANRSYVKLFTISAGQAATDTMQTISIPGDTTGTWLKDTGIGLTLNIVLACGSTFQTTANAWQAGQYFGTSGVSNGMGVGGAVFSIFDVGLYADPDATGTAPKWEIPQYTQELARCQRYWENSTLPTAWYGNITNTVSYQVATFFKAPKRVAPTVTLTNTGVNGFPASTGATNSYVEGFNETRAANATGNGGSFASTWAASARM